MVIHESLRIETTQPHGGRHSVFPHVLLIASSGELHAHCDNTAGFAAYEDDACKADDGEHRVLRCS